MDAFGEHRRAAGQGGGDKLRHGDGDVAKNRCHDGCFRVGRHVSRYAELEAAFTSRDRIVRAGFSFVDL